MQDHTTHNPAPKLCECGCGKQPKRPESRFCPGHNPTYHDQTPEQRFWKHVAIGSPSDCWEWQGATRNGYGALNIDGKVVYAHRFSYELHHRPLADGECTLHKCDNRLCANPSHLFAGTKGDNIRDMYAKGRGNTSGNERGNTPKLTEEQVRTIRTLAAQGVRYSALAKDFGVTIPNICLIVARKRWKYI